MAQNFGIHAGLAGAPIVRVSFKPIGDEPKLGSSEFNWFLEHNYDFPNIHIGAGTFTASDDEQVPYRFWTPMNVPRAYVVVLHGACDYSAAFEEIGPALATAGIATFAYDQRGFGVRRSRGLSLQPQLQISDLSIVCETARERIIEIYGKAPTCGRPFVLGESMGGGIAVCAAAAGLDIAGLVLVSPASLACPYRRVGFQFGARVLATLMPWSRWQIERRKANELTDVAAIRFLSDPIVLRSVRSRLFTQLFALAAQTARAASQVRVPSLTLQGSEENVLNRNCIKTMYRRLRGAKTFKLIPGGTHFLIHEKSNGQTFDLIINWILSRVEAVPFSHTPKP